MRRWIVCVMALMLSGCWTSEPPSIPPEALIQPPGLPGRYWTVSLEETVSDPALIEFRRGDAGGMIADAAGRSEGGTFRLVRTAIPGVYLKIIDNDQRSVFYGFIEHRDLGVWQDYGLAEIDQDVFTAPSLAWMQEIAGRYGLILDASETSETKIKGEIHGLAIPSLFADPAFLATLETAPFQLYLPNPPAPEEREDLFPQGDPSLSIQLDQRDLPGAQWVAPAGLEGQYVLSHPTGRFYRPANVRFDLLPDGRFAIGADPLNPQDTPRILGLLRLKGAQNEYLAVRFERWSYEGQESFYLALSILSQTEEGWSLADILRRGTETLLGRQDLLSQPMGEAAQRHGATLDQFRLRGGMTAQGLLDLLQDGQFTTGLKVNRETAEDFLR